MRKALLPAGAVAFVALYALLPPMAAVLAYLAVAAGATAAVHRLSRGRVRDSSSWWRPLGIGLTLWLLADVAWYAAELTPGPGAWVDALYLPAYGLFGAALWRLTRAVSAPRGRDVILDGLIMALAGGLVLLQFVLPPAVQATASGQRLLAGLYPVLDLVLLALIVRIIVFAAQRDASVRLLAGAFTMLLVGNLGYAAAGGAVPYPVGAVWDTTWLGFYVLTAAAARRHSPAAPDHRAAAEQLTPLRAALVASALLVTPVYRLVGHWAALPPLGVLGTALSLGVAVLVVTRLVLSLADQARAHSRLRASEERFATLVEHAFDAVTVHDAAGRVVYASPSATTVFGRDPATLHGERLISTVHPDDRAVVLDRLDALRGEPGPATFEVRALHPDGTYRWLEARARALTEDPLVRGTLVTTRDVTDRRQAEAALRHSEARFRAVFEHAGLGMVLDGVDGHVLDANGAVQELLGRSEDELIGRHFRDWTHPDDLAKDVELFREVVAGRRDNYRIDKRFLRPNGDERWGRLTVTTGPAGEHGERLFIGMIEDITEARASTERLRLQAQLLDAVGEAVIATDLDGRVTYWNPAAEQFYGWSASEAVGRSILDLNITEAVRQPAADIIAAVRAGRTWSGEFTVRRKDGRTFTALVTDSPYIDADGEVAGIIGVSTDISELKRTERRLQRRAQQQAALTRLGRQALRTGSVPRLNEAAVRLVRGTLNVTACTIGPPTTQHGGARLVGDADGAVSVPVAARDTVFAVLRVRLAAGRQLDPDDVRFLQAVANVLAAAIEHDSGQRQLEHQALHDALTGLPNRSLLLDRVAQALRRAERTGQRVAVLFADLDRFKLVNDGLGHGVGDRVLAAAAERLQAGLRPGDTIARLGGDEFAVLCDPVFDEADAIAVADRLLGTLSAPFLVDGNELFVTASIGAALGSGGDDAEALLRDADIAMYRAKELGRQRSELFDHGLQQAALEKLELANALRHAAERGELELAYQPEVELSTGHIIAVEALMRWNHPTHGAVPPGKFIPVAEETGVILALGEWALRRACATAAAWPTVDGTSPAVSVNLSARQLGQADLWQTVAEALRVSGLPPNRLWLEVTESAVMQNPDGAVATLRRLERLGVVIAIDDFGTGYSSLAQLKSFPFAALKIDRSFVSGLGADIQDRKIVAATIELARALGLLSIAEGVETRQQLDALRRLGCDVGQGYFWSRPMDGRGILTLLSRQPHGNGSTRCNGHAALP